MDLYSLGELVIDFTPGSEPASYIRNPGGAPGNAAIIAARSGLEAGVCSSLPASCQNLPGQNPMEYISQPL